MDDDRLQKLVDGLWSIVCNPFPWTIQAGDRTGEYTERELLIYDRGQRAAYKDALVRIQHATGKTHE